jgi:hypothetical protein
MATLLGGPLDGEVRPLEYGEVFRDVFVPIKRAAYEARLSPVSEAAPRYRYVARRDDDGRWWYVFAGRAT